MYGHFTEVRRATGRPLNMRSQEHVWDMRHNSNSNAGDCRHTQNTGHSYGSETDQWRPYQTTERESYCTYTEQAEKGYSWATYSWKRLTQYCMHCGSQASDSGIYTIENRNQPSLANIDTYAHQQSRNGQPPKQVQDIYIYIYIYITQWPIVRKRTIPTERPPLVGEI
jgi:hypothetical protein